VQPEGLGKLKRSFTSSDLKPACDLPACSISALTTTLLRAPYSGGGGGGGGDLKEF
jgi:hypothetical protein